MNEQLRDRILRRLDTLSDERGYQVLDYVEFLESKYAEKTAQTPNVFQRFAEGVEDSLRAGRVSATTIAETMGLLNKAMGVLSGVAAAGKSVASDVMDVATRTARSGGWGGPEGTGSGAAATSTSTTSTPSSPPPPSATSAENPPREPGT
jgi:hypothetical protein